MVFETTSQLHKPVIPTRSQKVGPKIKSVCVVMSFSVLPKVLKDLLLSFAGHKCEHCGTYDESKQCNHCKKHFCFEEDLNEDKHNDAPLCETCIQAYFKMCEFCDSLQLPNIIECDYCDNVRQNVCTTCVYYTCQELTCEKCFMDGCEEDFRRTA